METGLKLELLDAARCITQRCRESVVTTQLPVTKMMMPQAMPSVPTPLAAAAATSMSPLHSME